MHDPGTHLSLWQTVLVQSPPTVHASPFAQSGPPIPQWDASTLVSLKVPASSGELPLPPEQLAIHMDSSAMAMACQTCRLIAATFPT
jgi:hypothetical protein